MINAPFVIFDILVVLSQTGQATRLKSSSASPFGFPLHSLFHRKIRKMLEKSSVQRGPSGIMERDHQSGLSVRGYKSFSSRAKRTQVELDFPLRSSSPESSSERMMPASSKLFASVAVTGSNLRYRFEICKAMMPWGASF